MRHRPDRPCLPGRQAAPTQAGVQLQIHEDTPAEPMSLRAYEASATAYAPAEAETKEFQRGLGNAGTSLKIPKPSAFQNIYILENTAESKRYLYFVAFIFCYFTALIKAFCLVDSGRLRKEEA